MTRFYRNEEIKYIDERRMDWARKKAESLLHVASEHEIENLGVLVWEPAFRAGMEYVETSSKCNIEFDMSKNKHLIGLMFDDEDVQNVNFVDNMTCMIRVKLEQYYEKMKG